MNATFFSIVFSLASFSALAQSFSIDAPLYKAGIRCQGNIEGAKSIDFMEKSDGTYDLILSGGGIESSPFPLQNASVKLTNQTFVLNSENPKVHVAADFVQKLSRIQIDIVPTGFGVGSVIDINTTEYACDPLAVAQ